MGNQMFQYAFGKRLSIEHNAPLTHDFTWYTSYQQYARHMTQRTFDLDLFGIEKNRTKIRVDHDIGERISNYFNPNIYKRCCEKLSQDKSIRLGGFHQNFEYFKPYQHEIKKIFSKPKECVDEFFDGYVRIKNKISQSNSVGIHIRRGDYLKSSAHLKLTMGYYNNAINIIKSKIRNPFFYIFSDDYEWAVSNFSNPNMENFYIIHPYFFGERYINKFILMKSCKHHIMANSTYSFWASYLSDRSFSSPQIRICPQRWTHGRCFISSSLPESDFLVLPLGRGDFRN